VSDAGVDVVPPLEDVGYVGPGHAGLTEFLRVPLLSLLEAPDARAHWVSHDRSRVTPQGYDRTS
jgi:hypothetical protein